MDALHDRCGPNTLDVAIVAFQEHLLQNRQHTAWARSPEEIDMAQVRPGNRQQRSVHWATIGFRAIPERDGVRVLPGHPFTAALRAGAGLVGAGPVAGELAEALRPGAAVIVEVAGLVEGLHWHAALRAGALAVLARLSASAGALRHVEVLLELRPRRLVRQLLIPLGVSPNANGLRPRDVLEAIVPYLWLVARGDLWATRCRGASMRRESRGAPVSCPRWPIRCVQ
mmetsp:Transcript_87019/g.221609  ORF Transcript_87019/g.221609 Transcript_87019/m.221609 type:complete len:227 (+) Transcript_87019:375-1055(+)